MPPFIKEFQPKTYDEMYRIMLGAKQLGLSFKVIAIWTKDSEQTGELTYKVTVTNSADFIKDEES